MTAAVHSAELVLPAFAEGDAHGRAARSLLRRLAAEFPRAGLGITGSVGTGTHRPESDLDLVVADAGFRREMQFATVSEGIRAAVVCLVPAFDEGRERRWMLATGGDDRVVSMVRQAFVVRDPEGWLGGMQRTVRRLDAGRPARRDELLRLQRAEAAALVQALGGGAPAPDEHLQLRLLGVLLEAALLRHGLAMTSKQESRAVFETVRRLDPPLFDLLHPAVPLTHRSLALLLRALDHVFGPPPST